MTQEHFHEVFRSLPFGSVLPAGWLREQMQSDLAEGFVGHLDKAVPSLIHDPIYGSHRLSRNSASKDLGNTKDGDAEGEEQYQWWNSETQSNWWDGYIRHAFLLNDPEAIKNVEEYIDRILATQDEDGYIGIYDEELRYSFSSENGELWSKATLYRGLLAYYECTQSDKVWSSLVQAVNNVMRHYPLRQSSPFQSGMQFNGGVSHGLVFTDVLERMYFHTQRDIYREYALFLYEDFCRTFQSEHDAQLGNILNPHYMLQSHGVHTFEHIRPIIVAAYTKKDALFHQVLSLYLQRIAEVITITGGAIGDEWIAGRKAHPTDTGYEFCSLQELIDSYGLLLQKQGSADIGDRIEKTFYNAAQGARHPHHPCIAYLKTDNSWEMMGTQNGRHDTHRHQTRYKYSPAHQDVAVCCAPNAGRISPYFLQHSWMREDDTTLVATLLAPNILHTTVNGVDMMIENNTRYPFDHRCQFVITTSAPIACTIKIRKPSWADHLHVSEPYTIDRDYLVFQRTFHQDDYLDITFQTSPRTHLSHDEVYFSYGALIFARPLVAEEIPGKTYWGNLQDYYYTSADMRSYRSAPHTTAIVTDDTLSAPLIHDKTHEIEMVELLPLCKTILRQVTFPLSMSNSAE